MSRMPRGAMTGFALAVFFVTADMGCTTERPGEGQGPAMGDRPPVPTSEPVAQPTAPLPPMKSASSAPAPALTAEELALIEKDPKDLSPEDRRLRAYALRKKIMQNPDSPTARSLEDLRKAVEAGEIQLPAKEPGPRLHAKTSPEPSPASGGPPAGNRPDAPTPESQP